MRLLSARYGNDMVEKLAESRGMRSVARAVAILIFRGRDQIKQIKDSGQFNDLTQKGRNFSKTFKEEIEKAKDELKKKK